ncbi:urease accessory protein [Lutimaribacter pacificus]|uniref:Urease accessory protein n=1 Tax=Lutimaribacter pacificus TaxID=391948 RepID=A0A1H0HRG6_9RHOB|nr:HupE/UreJ family protein [Lutimaribacter pacificus]SDO21411.1 urease accessory protein [Lutimaribacter pacificus]SHK32530.1 urease accessory protein [Lutimaribacter pacificus]
MTRIPLFLLPALVVATPALAHLEPGEHGSFAAGMTHPLFGADHVLAMVCVGLWAALMPGRALVALPAGFVGAMVLGFGAALGGLGLPMVEPVILSSVLVLGVLVALAVRLPLAGAVALVAGFGFFHGHAHGLEIGVANALPYLSGFVAATVVLHMAGLACGVALERLNRPGLLRSGGGAVAALGAWLLATG